MKKLVYNVALALCAMVTINSCSLDEYNPMEVTGEETLATFDRSEEHTSELQSPS